MQSDAQLKKMIHIIDSENRIGLKGAHDACLSDKLDDIFCKTLSSDVINFIATIDRIHDLHSQQRDLRENFGLDNQYHIEMYDGLEEKLEVEGQKIAS